MNRAKYLAKNTILFAIGNLGTRLISFFLVPLYTNVLSTGEYGTVDLIFTVCSFAVPVLILNINEAIMRFAIDKDADSNKIMSAGLAVMGVSFVTGIILALAAKMYGPTSGLSGFVYLYAVSFGMESIFISYLRGRELLLRFSIGNILHALFVAVFNIIFLLVFKWGIKGYLLAYICANVLTSIYAYFAGSVKSVFANLSVDRKLLKDMMRFSLVLIPNSFMWWIMNSSDRVMLTAMSGAEVNGIYAVSNKLPALIAVVATIFNTAYSYSAVKEDDAPDRVEYANQVYDYLVSFVTIMTIAVMVIIKPFLHIYVAQSYYEAWRYTPPLVLGAAVLVLANFMAMQYMVKKDSRGILVSSSIGAGVNILLNFALIPVLGALGAAAATLTGYAAVFLFRHKDTEKYLVIKAFSRQHCFCYAAMAVSTVLVYCGGAVPVAVQILLIAVLIYFYKDNYSELIRKLFSAAKKTSKENETI